MKIGLLGRKVGMTRIYDDHGRITPVTVIEVGGNVPLEIKTEEKHGYSAVQVGYHDQKEQRVNKPELGHFKKHGATAKKLVREFRLPAGTKLEGAVEWQYQKERAEECVRKLHGVRLVSNLITLKGKPVAIDIKERIAAALKRSAQLEAERIQVDVDGTQVTLKGRVRSWAEHEEAANMAWSAPGVLEVKNYLSVGP